LAGSPIVIGGIVGSIGNPPLIFSIDFHDRIHFIFSQRS
jgi:hypothetical protein